MQTSNRKALHLEMLEHKADFYIYYPLTALLDRLTASVIFVIAP